MENKVINYYDFMSKRIILHSLTATNTTDGIKFLIKNEGKADMITYNHTDKFSLFGDILHVNENKHYFYEYSPKRNGDIMDNIRFESTNLKVKLTYYIGGAVYDPEEVDEFLTISTPFHDFRIRITFLEKPNVNDEFMVHSRMYLIEPETRKLLTINTVITKTNIYNSGMCARLNNYTRGGGSLTDHRAYVN